MVGYPGGHPRFAAKAAGNTSIYSRIWGCTRCPVGPTDLRHPAHIRYDSVRNIHDR